MADDDTDGYETDGEVTATVVSSKSKSNASKMTSWFSLNKSASKLKKSSSAMTARRRRPRKTKLQKCMDASRWVCDDLPLWRVYMKGHAEDEQELAQKDRFKRRKPATLAKLPRVVSQEGISPTHKCFPLSAFQMKQSANLPDKLDRKKMIRIWKNMRANPPVHASKSSDLSELRGQKAGDKKWPGVWPCTTRDLMRELRERYGTPRKEKKYMFPCDPIAEDEPIFDEPQDDFAERKELGHARIPETCPPIGQDLVVDRATGEQPGLVDGDYIIFELPSSDKGRKIYADVCLRGLKGMHLPELAAPRMREKTWKFCFYHAVVVLLAKTQLRYKYAWSANIDYIYDHAWMLFTHIGTLNVKNKQRLDDIVVYNYKYSVELEMIQELNDVPILEGVNFDYEEHNLSRKAMLQRKDLMYVKVEIGSEKVTDQQTAPVHKGIRKIEKWFDRLQARYRNCIFRTTRFCVAFWNDGSFWYLYNPYRCDEFGYWNDEGYACIVKFCSKRSLKRHLMILLLRAHAYTTPKAEPPEVTGLPAPLLSSPSVEKPKNTGDETTEKPPECYTVQIFNIIYHCCQIQNLKLLERSPPKSPQRYVKRKTIDDCAFDPLDIRDPCSVEQEDDESLKEPMEKPTWLKLYKISWAKCVPTSDKKKANKEVAVGMGKMRWHQYIVEESNKLFSLFGEIHITDGMFEKENRGMQTYACYVVCAGMTRIMAPEYWSSKTLDVIVMCGDRYYTHSKLEGEFKSTKGEYSHVSSWTKYLSSHFRIGDTMFETKVLPAICGRLYTKSSKFLWRSLEQLFLKYQFAILTCESSCLGLFKFCGAYYMCDVSSFGPPLFQYGDGAAYLIRATYFFKFMTVLIMTVASPECSQFALNPVEILKVIDVGPSIFPERKIDRERGKRGKEECPFDEAKKKQMRRWKHKRAETGRTIDKLCCKGE